MLRNETNTKTILVAAESIIEGDAAESFVVPSSSSSNELSTASISSANSNHGTPLSPNSIALSLAQAGEILGERFEILSFLGQGGMGSVFKVYDRSLKNTFAVKILKRELLPDEASRKRFEKEAKAAMRMTHAHLTAVYEFGLAKDNSPYLLMDCLEGKTLEKLLEEEGPLEPARAIELFLQLCDALDFAHGKGLIHRDIKPSNIMVTSPEAQCDYVKLFDFGIAKVMTNRCVEMTAEITRAGGILGSPAYLAPEQCRGKEASISSDIHALGCVMYKALSGRHPFEGTNVIETAVNIATQEAAPFAELDLKTKIPPSLEQAILRCLSKSPEDRYNSIAQLKIDLLSLQSGKQISVGNKQKKQQLKWTRNIFVVALTGLLSFGATTYLSQNNPVAKELSHGYFISVGQTHSLTDFESMEKWADIHISEGHYERAIYLLDLSERAERTPGAPDPYWVDRICNNSPAKNTEWRSDWKEFAVYLANDLTKIGDCELKLNRTGAAAYYYNNALRLFQKSASNGNSKLYDRMHLNAAVSGYARVLELTQHCAEAKAFRVQYQSTGKLKDIPSAGTTWKPE